MLKKLIALVFLVIFSSLLAAATPTYYAYDEDEWGNLQYITGNTGNIGLELGVNRTACFPFVAGQDGYITSFAFSGTSTGLMDYCLSTDLQRSFSDDYENSCPDGINGWFGFNNPKYTGDDAFEHKFYKGEKMYACFQGQTGGGDTYVFDGQATNSFTVNQADELYGTISQTDITSNQQLTANDYETYYTDYNAGTWTAWKQTTKRPESFQYCMVRYEDDPYQNCYTVSGTNPSQYGNCEGTGIFQGELFQWTQDTQDVSNYGMYLMWGTTTSGAESIKMRLMHYDPETNTTVLMDGEPAYSYSDLDGQNVTFLQDINVPANISMVEGDWYIIEAKCNSGCSGGADSLCVAYQRYKTTGGYHEYGFQGDEGHYVSTDAGGIITDVEYDDVPFKISTTDAIWLSDETAAEIEDVLNCPYTNCLFYDDFNYYDYYDLAYADWTQYTDSAIVRDKVLYLNSSYDFASGLPIIEHTIASHTSDEYGKVVSVTQFNIDKNTTPTSMDEPDNDFIVYRNTALCNGSYAFTWNVYFIRDDAWTGSENRTVVNLYSWQNAAPKLLGTFTQQNGEYFLVKNEIDYSENKAYLTIIRQEDVQSGFIPLSMFSQELEFPCEQVTSFELGRRDLENVVNDEFVSIEKVFWYGVVEEDEDNDYDFVYSNQTTQEDAIVKGDIGEDLHNAAFSLGFKTTATKLLFWIIICGFAAAMLVHSNTSKTTKQVGIVAVIIAGIIAGFYLKFVPTIVFVFMLFVVALAGAFVVQRALTGTGGG